MSTRRDRSHSPRLFAWGSKRVDDATRHREGRGEIHKLTAAVALFSGREIIEDLSAEQESLTPSLHTSTSCRGASRPLPLLGTLERSDGVR